MRQMDWAESSRFLLHGTRTAKIGTVSADGQPHIVPVWFTLHDGALLFSTSSSSAKARNLIKRPRVAVAVDDERPPFAFVSITGRAELLERPADFLHWTTTIAARYMGDERAEEFGKQFIEIDDLLVRIRVESFVGRAEVVG